MVEGATTALLAGGDLMAKARLREAAATAGVVLVARPAAALLDALAERSFDLLIVDLDEGQTSLLADLSLARERGIAPGRAVGYFSHVDASLGERAKEAGCDALPRGRFWRSLPDILNPD
jgi:hypothetical protein